jgi:hypothetical protein
MGKYPHNNQFDENIKVDFCEKLRGFDVANRNGAQLNSVHGLNIKICRRIGIEIYKS